jgi:hypothetical protein
VKNNSTLKCSHSVEQNLLVHIYELNVIALTIKFYIFLINERSVFVFKVLYISQGEGCSIFIMG